MSVKPPLRKKHKSLSLTVAEAIATDIRANKLKIGDKLPTESEIMRLYEVSRTVVREAISHLRAEGLVHTQHGIGTFIQAQPAAVGFQHQAIMTMRDILNILELRISLETEAAWLAASRRSEEQMGKITEAFEAIKANPASEQSVQADRRFHQLIAEATGNPYFVNILSELGTQLIPRARLNLDADNPLASASYQQRLNNEHEDIWSAILHQDPEAARAAMRTHLSKSRERLRDAQQKVEADLADQAG